MIILPHEISKLEVQFDNGIDYNSNYNIVLIIE